MPTLSRRIGVTAALLLAAAIATAAPPAFAPPEAAPTPDLAIERAVTAVRSLAGARRLLLLGEFHGTREIPRLVARLATDYAAEGPVVVGLEVDHREQAALDAYLRSDGGRAARAALVRGRFWQRADDQHSALATHDLLDLVEDLRRLRIAGRDVAVLAYDVATTTPRPDRDWRDRAMAASVGAAFRALPRGRLLMLTGNVHAMKQRPAYLPPQAPRPAGTWLQALGPFSVRLMAQHGYFWSCPAPARCGPSPADGKGARTRTVEGEYDALVVLPRFSVARVTGAANAE